MTGKNVTNLCLSLRMVRRVVSVSLLNYQVLCSINTCSVNVCQLNINLVHSRIKLVLITFW